jgi:hypothetical protein
MKHNRTFQFLAAIFTGIIFTGLAYAVHPTVSLSGSDFEIDTDANLAVDHSPASSFDWANVSDESKGDLPSGSNDDSFGQGSKEDTEVPAVVSGSIPPNKSDLKTFGVYLEDNGISRFLHMYWHRVQDPSGTTNMDFEFNQSGNLPNGVTPERTAGDILVQYDLSQGGTNPELFMSYWLDGSENPPATKIDCEASNKLPCWGEQINLTDAGVATGSINTSAIVAVDSDGLGDISPRTFGEATIDFESIAGGAGSCVTFGSAHLKSRSSDSFTSALKDFIAPVAVLVSNCASLKIIKQDDDDLLIGGIEFKLFADNSPTGGTYNPPPGEDGNTALHTCTTAASGTDIGTCTMTGILAGDYWVVETAAPTGHDIADPQPITIAAGGSLQTFTFTNTRQPASVTINKKDDAGKALQGAIFTLYEDHATNGTVGVFDGAGTDPAVTPGKTCTTNASGTCTISDILPPGNYCVDETTVPTGHTKAAAQCFTLALNDAITLDDFVDNRQPASVTINKKDDAGAVLEGATFTLYVDHATNGTVGVFDGAVTDPAVTPGKTCTTNASGTCTISDILPPGNYCVDETTVPTGYTKAAPQCFNLILNQDRTLPDFVDTRLPASVTINKKDDVGAALEGATFTLYVDHATNGTVGVFDGAGTDPAVTPGKTCTTNASGTCTISDILPPGNYCVDETTVPTGYTKADPQCFDLILNQDRTLPDFVDSRLPASVTIIKKDDAGAALDGAEFTLYEDKGVTGTFESGTDPAVDPVKSCTTVGGTCTISDILPPGDYCVDETIVPTDYNKADSQCFSLAFEQDLTLTTFVNPRKTGAIRITKTRKHAAAASPSNDPHAGVEFTITGGELPEGGTKVTTNAQGIACLDGLFLSSLTGIGDYTVTETVPTNYVADGDVSKDVTVSTEASCNEGSPATVAFSNTPLTDITVSVDSLVDGGTKSTITCTLGGLNVGSVTPAEEDPTLSLQNVEPGTYICTIFVDP